MLEIELVGRNLGNFVVRNKLGQGGSGKVYRAVQPLLEREAAIKVMIVGQGLSTAATERFLREARLASRLDHPYAAHIYAFGVESDGLHWIAMELVQGVTLGEWLRSRGPMSLEAFVPFF